MELEGTRDTQHSVIESFEMRSEAKSTITSASFGVTTALGLTLFAFQHGAAVGVMKSPPVASIVQFAHQSSTQTTTLTLNVNEGVTYSNLLKTLLEFHDAIVSSQEDLPASAREVFFANLWQLYE